MANECCLSLTKYFLFLFNLTFFLLGLLLLSLGLWILFSDANLFMAMTPPYMSISLLTHLLIISGSVTMSLGFLGCLGSLKTVKCLLAIYFILLTVLLTAQIVGGVLFYTQKTELTGSLKQPTLEIIQSFGKDESSLKSFEKTLEYIQKEAKCCGWHGGEDWGDSAPCSCYYKGNATANATYETTCHECFTNSTLSNFTCEIYNQGCSEHISKWVEENVLLILVVFLAISVVEICGMILSMCLYKEGSMDYKIMIY